MAQLDMTVATAAMRGLNAMSIFWARTGTTSFLPTTTTALYDDTVKAMSEIAGATKRGVSGAKIAGINMEGPYLSAQYKGAHRADWLRSVHEFDFDTVQAAAGGMIKLVTVAPETEGALAFIKAHGKNVRISLGHTGADFDTCMRRLRTARRGDTFVQCDAADSP